VVGAFEIAFWEVLAPLPRVNKSQDASRASLRPHDIQISSVISLKIMSIRVVIQIIDHRFQKFVLRIHCVGHNGIQGVDRES
jgi:hypothetical protein